MADIRWENFVWKDSRPLSPSELEPLEKTWGITLPEEYKRVVVSHQGQAPCPCVFRVGRGANVFAVLLTVTHDAERASYSIRESYSLLRPHVAPGLYPFGKTSGGEYLCFEYKNSSARPGVVLVTVDMTVHPVARSFEELLAGLHDD
ncbi:SMI1/KNR4 family protein [Melittangium boletus]|uniref:SMI1/KNR4 family protein n=1 Tax=Melittangium boletus TaxID=83453 RepID=UPI003DA268C3